MYAVVRRYTGADALADAMVPKAAEVTELLSSIPGFKAYYALRTGSGGVTTITVCEDKAGTEESVRRAAEWVRANLSGASISPPEISEGDVYISF
jgi:hypothetical protein